MILQRVACITVYTPLYHVGWDIGLPLCTVFSILPLLLFTLKSHFISRNTVGIPMRIDHVSR